MSCPGLEPSRMIDVYDWAALGIVVDVDGSHGTLCMEIARRFLRLHCIIQDQPSAVDVGRETLPLSMQDRVDFVEHGSFTARPIKGASVYISEWILRNWPGSYAVKTF